MSSYISAPAGRISPCKSVAISAISCLLAIASPVFSQTSHTGPSAQQDADTIRQILARDSIYERTTITQRQDYKSLTERKYQVTEVDGCKMVVTVSGHSHAEMPAQNRINDRKWNDIYHPDFSVMDPSTVVVNDPEPPQPQWQVKGYLVRISVEIGKPLMPASTVDLATSASRILPGLPTLAVYVSSRESADKLAKSFGQLATACRANPPAK